MNGKLFQKNVKQNQRRIIYDCITRIQHHFYAIFVSQRRSQISPLNKSPKEK